MIQQSLFGEKKKSKLLLEVCMTDENMCIYCKPQQLPTGKWGPYGGMCLYVPVYKKIGSKRVNVGTDILNNIFECPCLKDTGKIPMRFN